MYSYDKRIGSEGRDSRKKRAEKNILENKNINNLVPGKSIGVFVLGSSIKDYDSRADCEHVYFDLIEDGGDWYNLCDSLWMVDESGNHFVGAANIIVSSKDPSISAFDGYVDVVKVVGAIHDVKCMFIGLDSDIESLCNYRRRGKLVHYKYSSPFPLLPLTDCCYIANDGKIEHYPQNSYNTIPFMYY